MGSSFIYKRVTLTGLPVNLVGVSLLKYNDPWMPCSVWIAVLLASSFPYLLTTSRFTDVNRSLVAERR